MLKIHHLLCDMLNLFYTKPQGEEYSWTWTELILVYVFLILILIVGKLAVG